MAFLSKGKKIDLYNLASELRVSVTLEDKIIDLREKINSCTFFQDNEQFMKEMLDNIVDERKSLEVEDIKKIEREDKCLADQRAFELEKLKLQAQNPPASVGCLSELEIESFETLKDLIIADQIKKRCPPDCKNHFLDTWEKLNDPVLLAEKLDSYENVKPSSQKSTKLPKPQELNTRFSRNTGNPEFRKSQSFKVEKNVSGNHISTFANPSYMPTWNTNTGFHPPISCYGYGNPGFIKSKCPKGSQIKRVPLSTPYRCLLLPPQ
ncbi:retrovirus-related Pol polyprotein from transposon 412 [Trichonephila inaurata madagascariensis]|uniref:Retrovirus-related Pol polyprotein from transposon 412 n=1 Tax=Trichonephila inaurata madagascariensis TaxID=2747483 RepID=A0A8X6YRJ3_9ARAC|nr:retrovirus-related Pol polyprotein from transposon 412 [Trichonephila inaurata madagascariensis]